MKTVKITFKPVRTLSVPFGHFSMLQGLAYSLMAVDEQLALQFKIPATLPLEQFLQKQLYKGEFLSILSNILKQLIYFDENLMSFNKLLLNVHYMYIELSSLDIQLIFMPVTKKFADCKFRPLSARFVSRTWPALRQWRSFSSIWTAS